MSRAMLLFERQADASWLPTAGTAGCWPETPANGAFSPIDLAPTGPIGGQRHPGSPTSL
jgi:hypothetical protein